MRVHLRTFWKERRIHTSHTASTVRVRGTSSRRNFSCWASTVAVALAVEPAPPAAAAACFRLSFENMLPNLMLSFVATLILWCDFSWILAPFPDVVVVDAADDDMVISDDDTRVDDEPSILSIHDYQWSNFVSSMRCFSWSTIARLPVHFSPFYTPNY